MKRRRWDSKTKTKIVLEGLSGRPVSEICNEYGIHQNQYYIWRDKFLLEAHKAFDSKKDSGEIESLRKKNKELFWLKEWENERELSLELNKWVEYYNRSYIHSHHFR